MSTKILQSEERRMKSKVKTIFSKNFQQEGIQKNIRFHHKK